MNQPIAVRAGSALAWNAVQLVGVKVIFLVRTVVLARLLLPDDFGLLAVSLIAIDFLTNVTNLGMLPALVQRRDLQEHHYDAAWTVGMIRASAITLVVFLAAPTIAALLEEPRATSIIRVMAFKPFLAALASIKIVAITRRLHFRRLTLISMPDAIVNTVVSLVLARPLGVWGLVAGMLAGQAAYVAMSYWLTPHRPRFLLDPTAVRPLINFGRWLFLTSIVALAGRSLLQVVITQRLGAADLGLYFLAAKLAFIPAEISSEVVGAVAFPLYAQVQNDAHKAAGTFRSIFVGLSALVLPICTLLAVLAPALVDTVLGPRWDGATTLIQLLALVNVIGLLGDNVVPLLKGMGHPSGLVIIEVIQSAVLIGVIWAYTERFGVLVAAYAWLSAVGASQLISVFFLRRLLPEPFSRLGTPLITIISVCVIGGLTAWVVVSQVPGLVGLIIAVITSMMAIGLLLWRADRHFDFGLASTLKRAFPQISWAAGPSSG